MVSLSDPPEDPRTIEIDPEVYDSVREFCDRHDLRFLDFVEEALETAMFFHAQENQVEENQELLRRIRRDYQKIKKIGFDEGFFIAVRLFGGKHLPWEWREALRQNVKDTPKLIEGEQMKLF
jgi:hypothetical protein